VRRTKPSVALSIGNLAAIDKVDGLLGGYFKKVFGKIGGKMNDFIPLMKLMIYNKLGASLAINHLDSYPTELYNLMGFKKPPKERSIYRGIERAGKAFAFIIEQHQKVIKDFDLVDDNQIIDFSSTYFEGKAKDVGDFGYSRDKQPGKKQIVFGISTGINGIPTALTIQKGNVPDKDHFRFMLRTASAVLDEESLLIFDCGANSKKNKQAIRKLKLNYLTLKPKKRGPYKAEIAEFRSADRPSFKLNGRIYEYAKLNRGDEFHYVYYSEQLRCEQLGIKRSKLTKEIKRNQPLLNKTKAGKPIGEYPCTEGTIVAKGTLQKNLDDEFNPHITGLEGYFILESSVDADPIAMLLLYKERDKAEKLIRNIKEGTELRPIRHFSPKAILGYILLVFLTNFIINLTLLEAKNPVVKNVKLLKNYLTNLTVTIVYPPNGFRFHILANVSPEIQSIFGDYVDRYRDKSLKLRW
jgi:transposase